MVFVRDRRPRGWRFQSQSLLFFFRRSNGFVVSRWRPETIQLRDGTGNKMGLVHSGRTRMKTWGQQMKARAAAEEEGPAGEHEMMSATKEDGLFNRLNSQRCQQQ